MWFLNRDSEKFIDEMNEQRGREMKTKRALGLENFETQTPHLGQWVEESGGSATRG